MRAAAGTVFAKGISRLLPEIRCKIPSAGARKLVLTFDDGPTSDGTAELCDVLSRHSVRAAFFLVGTNALRHPQRVRELHAAGHLIGNHSLTHIDAWRASRTRIFAEMSRCSQVLADLTGRPIESIRPPYGRITKGLVKWSRRNRQNLLLWDVMPADFQPGTTPEQIVEHLQRKSRPGSVICLHDNAKARPVTAKALRSALPQLLGEGWEFCLPAA